MDGICTLIMETYVTVDKLEFTRRMAAKIYINTVGALHFDDCSGNEGLEFAISNPGLRVEADGSVFAVKNMEATMSGFIIQATSIHAQDSADVQVVRGEDNHSSVLKEALKIGNISILHRRKRSLIAPPISFPENQRGPFPKIIGRIITDRIEGIKFQLHGKGVEEEPKGVFKINDQSGEIIVTRSLDREEMDMYIVSITHAVYIPCIVEPPLPATHN
ncbi:hypothetical protein scyTo_0000282 [Scyliorhinus torazame]|uniref:Cadherin-13 n=1 Tax=Scyliorhinus torazame TaxID=75743 RepID=A0A401NUH1_SCYTO|nr:hypothetical protein [Scyliorhinus torazame]